MKAVMISIQPRWCNLIVSGKKTIEVRKTKPKLKRPFKCYIYCTNKFHKNGLYPKETFWHSEKIINGKVIGEFICDGMMCCGAIFAPHGLRQHCLTQEQLVSYSNGKELYGWRISNLVIYDKPKELREFYSYKVCKDYWDGNSGCDDVCGIAENNQCMCGHAALTRPPQSWCYVECYD